MFWTFINFFPFQRYELIIYLSLLASSRFTFRQFSTYRVTLSYIVQVCFPCNLKVARVTPLSFLFFDNKTRDIPDLRSGWRIGEGGGQGPPFQTLAYNVYLWRKENE